MNRSTVPCDSVAGIPPRKRRYSSTAVGFPIRYDLSAHSQGVSEGFPSWERARCACTYVCSHAKCDYQPKELPSSSLLATLFVLVSTVSTPSAVLIFCSFAASLILWFALRKPNEQTGSSLPSPPLPSEFCYRLAWGSLGSHLKTCTVHPPSVLHTFSPRSVYIQSTFSPHSVHIQSTFSPRSVLAQILFRVVWSL